MEIYGKINLGYIVLGSKFLIAIAIFPNFYNSMYMYQSMYIKVYSYFVVLLVLHYSDSKNRRNQFEPFALAVHLET